MNIGIEQSRTVVVGTHTYSIAPLNAFEQLQLARRLAPLASAIPEVLQSIATLPGQDADAAESSQSYVAFGANMVGKFGEVLAARPEEQVNYVLNVALSKVRRLNGSSAAPVASTNNKDAEPILMFADIKPIQLLELAWHVLSPIRDFFEALLSSGSSAVTQGSPTPPRGV